MDMKGGALSYYHEDKAREKAIVKLESLENCRDRSMRRYHSIFSKLKEQMEVDEILEIFCKRKNSVMYSNWCNNGVYFLSDDNVRRVFNNIISAIKSEEDRIARPSFAKNFG